MAIKLAACDHYYVGQTVQHHGKNTCMKMAQKGLDHHEEHHDHPSIHRGEFSFERDKEPQQGANHEDDHERDHKTQQLWSS